MKSYLFFATTDANEKKTRGVRIFFMNEIIAKKKARNSELFLASNI